MTRLRVVSQISRDEVAHLARLARLALTEDELDSYAGQLDAIIGHVSQIQAVDVAGVDPTDNPLTDVNVFRPDVVTPCLSQEEALDQAPKAAEGRFAVPRILGEAE
ncbi:aspartyl/glutamyl-tRNA(Asn/Gln) amidotransferase subunit C [Mycolicibacterium rutilum]|uniref:Aspartyl/glutamyl-tRNA(Asn/Gln) amidotransferase subunit C n=1 Tax=Mycolicibacterium rutilum TaxID=370526 RepID=A0A1H6LL69_MYCRU|nr:aspartyl/glutamyl-tRNA(Asn/Gln) amidotransferase subunit C [Mycolicibacterium rutilum]